MVILFVSSILHLLQVLQLVLVLQQDKLLALTKV